MGNRAVFWGLLLDGRGNIIAAWQWEKSVFSWRLQYTAVRKGFGGRSHIWDKLSGIASRRGCCL